MSAKKMCSVCKEKPATVFLTNISSDDKAQKLDLCDECAKAKGLDSNLAFFPFADTKLGLGASQEIETASGGVETRCPRCGFTQADFKKSGRLGCAQCYLTFSEGLGGLLKTMHKGTRHVGKAPEVLRESRDMAERVKTLKKKLERAIEEEKFELAAELRDQISELSSRRGVRTA
jgi:protein arginine kinase activator